MKLRIFLAAALLLTLLSANVSCVCSSDGVGSFTELVEMVPKDATSFTFWNVEALGSDVYTIWKEWKNEMLDDDWLENMGGIQTEDVKYFSQALIPELGVVTIITGDFNLDEIEQKLDDAGYESGKYQEVKILEKADDESANVIALYKGIIVGNKTLVENCIDVIKNKNGSLSLYEDTTMREIADKLPSGVMIGMAKNETLYEDLVGLGVSVNKKDNTTLDVKVEYKFAVSGAAASEDTLTKVQDDLAEVDLPAIKVKCSDAEVSSKDEFIEATGSMSIEDFSYFALVEPE